MRKAITLLLTLFFLIPLVLAQEIKPILLLGGIPGDKLVRPTSISKDRQGNIYIICEGTNEIISFTKDLKLRFRIGGFGDSEANFEEPADCAVVRDSFVVSDIGCLKVFDLKGNFKNKITKIGDLVFKRPMGLSVDLRNRLYVADPNLSKVAILEPELTLWRTISNLAGPISCWVLPNGNYLVLERDGKRLTLFSSSFAKIRSFGTFKNPLSMTFDEERLVYILDGDSFKTFTVATAPGVIIPLNSKIPGGVYPGIAVLDYNVYFASLWTNELVKFNNDGLMTTLITRDSSPLCLPSGMVVDDNGRIYIADAGNDIVRVLDQKGNPLWTFNDTNLGRMSISKDHLAIVKPDSNRISIYSRDGTKLFDIAKDKIIDCDFAPDGSLLVLSEDRVDRFLGSKETDNIYSQNDWHAVAISSCLTHFAVAVDEIPRVLLFDHLGVFVGSINLPDNPSDILLLSPQRLIALSKSGMYLIDQNSIVMRKYGEFGGPRSSHGPLSDGPKFDQDLEKFTQPVAIARFGQWLYTIDRGAMRMVRFPKDALLAPPKVKISPETLDFGNVKPDGETTRELVIQNVGGDSLEGYFVSIPRWISVSSRMIRGDDIVVRVDASTLHFISNMTYLEPIVIETNDGRFEIPCKLSIPEVLPKQIDIELQIGRKTAKIDGKSVDLGVSPFIDRKTSSTMIPLRFVSEAFGGIVTFDGGYISIAFTSHRLYITLQVDSYDIIVDENGETKFEKIDPAPRIISGKTFIPLGFFTDILGCEKYWDPQTKIIRILYIPQ